MGEDVTLYSRHLITFEELSVVLLAANGEPVTPKGGWALFGRVEAGSRYILIHGDTVPDEPETLWNTDVYYLSIELMEEIAAKLGGKPAVKFMLEIGHPAKSGVLAVKLAYQCALRWPCVVLGEVSEKGAFINMVFTKEDMEHLLAEGKDFTNYRMYDDDEEDDNE